MHAAPSPDWIGSAIAGAIILLVLAIRLRRLGRHRPLRIERLWIVPALYLVIVALAFGRMPPHGLAWLGCAAALAAGAALGWQRGRMMRIIVDPATHAISQATSPAALLFIVVLIAVRWAARAEGGAAHLDVMTLTDLLLAFGLGLLSVQRLEMYLRARRLLETARAA